MSERLIIKTEVSTYSLWDVLPRNYKLALWGITILIFIASASLVVSL